MPRSGSMNDCTKEMKVQNLTSPRTGCEVANQFEIVDDHGNRYFQSYKSLIVQISNSGGVVLDENYWNYSVTTSKYRNQFLGETTKETQAKIDAGEYELANLN